MAGTGDREHRQEELCGSREQHSLLLSLLCAPALPVTLPAENNAKMIFTETDRPAFGGTDGNMGGGKVLVQTGYSSWHCVWGRRDA